MGCPKLCMAVMFTTAIERLEQGICQTHSCSVRVRAWVLWPSLRAVANREYFDDILYFPSWHKGVLRMRSYTLEETDLP